MSKATCLSLLSNAVLVWNTIETERIVLRLKAGGAQISDEDIALVAPLFRYHVKADYIENVACPKCKNDCDINPPATCQKNWRWSQQQQRWLWTITFQRGTQVCEAYPYEGWPDTKEGYCRWLCH